MLANTTIHIGVIGLGYVGLPLAAEFSKHFPTIGLDINQQRIEELRRGHDSTGELSDVQLSAANSLSFTSQTDDLATCNIYIITVPTPIDVHKRPDLKPLQDASLLVGNLLSKNDIIVYESTVYPGATEEVCIPLLEQASGLTFNKEFTVAYSPERINPGDPIHSLTNVVKITSGSTTETAAFIDKLYRQIITAGTHQVSSLRVAEAAKVIENIQRDVNIALVNELAMIFNRLHLDTEEVLLAAGSKWNFLPFKPGLVGGHCIGVDPYYLTHKAQEIAYHPEVILAGRRINDGMGSYVAEQLIKLMTRNRIGVVDSRILVLGLAFKENCGDIRNTRVIDIISELSNFHTHVSVYDPWVSSQHAKQEYGIELMADTPEQDYYDAILLAVAHEEFKTWGAAKIRRFGKSSAVVYDVKHVLEKSQVDGRL